MNQHLRKMLQNLLANPIIVESWGMKGFKVERDSASFSVEGLKYQGVISIESKEDTPLYTIRCLSINKSYHDVPLDDIVEMLDVIIERSDDYLRDLATWIIQHKNA